jgi:hypothetical protein
VHVKDNAAFLPAAPRKIDRSEGGQNIVRCCLNAYLTACQ